MTTIKQAKLDNQFEDAIEDGEQEKPMEVIVEQLMNQKVCNPT